MTGLEIIAIERKRQIEVEGYNESHDKKYSIWSQGERVLEGSKLVAAAHCYEKNNSSLWPWNFSYWKPTPENPIKQLSKAGALYQAEADRLNAYIIMKDGNCGSDIRRSYHKRLKDVERISKLIDAEIALAEQALKEDKQDG